LLLLLLLTVKWRRVHTTTKTTTNTAAKTSTKATARLPKLLIHERRTTLSSIHRP
jgi:hypothetical protein